MTSVQHLFAITSLILSTMAHTITNGVVNVAIARQKCKLIAKVFNTVVIRNTTLGNGCISIAEDSFSQINE